MVQLRGGDLLLSDSWAEQPRARSHTCGHGGVVLGGGGGASQPLQWLHIEQTLDSVRLLTSYTLHAKSYTFKKVKASTLDPRLGAPGRLVSTSYE